MTADIATRSRSRLASRRRVPADALLAAGVLTIIVAACLLAPLITPHHPNHPLDIIGLKSQPPSAAHPFGTDPWSRDVLSRVLHGGRVSLAVALLATLVSITVGTFYGAVAGYATGFKAVFFARMLDALLAVPRVLLLIAILAFLTNPPLWVFVVALGATGWYALARIVRGQVLALRERDFVISAKAMGASHSRILFRHILPNIVTPIVVAATLGIGQVIVLEAGLSYLGIGVRLPGASWGNMIQNSQYEFATYWWTSLFPALAIVLTVLVFNVLGDALLRALQPRQTGTE